MIPKGGNQSMQIEEEQTTQWPKETGQKDKQRSTKHCTENKIEQHEPHWKSGVSLCAPEW